MKLQKVKASHPQMHFFPVENREKRSLKYSSTINYFRSDIRTILLRNLQNKVSDHSSWNSSDFIIFKIYRKSMPTVINQGLRQTVVYPHGRIIKG